MMDLRLHRGRFTIEWNGQLQGWEVKEKGVHRQVFLHLDDAETFIRESQ